MKCRAVAAAILSSASISYAADATRLIEGCQELIRIYEKHDQKRVLAGWTTSVSDAMKAGYCRGVIDEFRRNNGCAGSNWHRQATQIANADAGLSAGSAESLLERSCGRY